MWLKETDEWIDYSFSEARTGKYKLIEHEELAFDIDLFKEAIYEDIIEPVINKLKSIL